jgi:hypothetical protein
MTKTKPEIESSPALTDAFGFPLEGPASGRITTATPVLEKLAAYLMVSPYESDGGEKIGRVPREIPIDALRALGGPETRSKAIRAKCIDCSGGNPTEVRKCVAIGCALWPFRMGPSPFRGKADDAETDGEVA